MQVTEADAVNVVETAIKRHSSDLTTQAICLIALLKLSSHYSSCTKYVVLILFHLGFCLGIHISHVIPYLITSVEYYSASIFTSGKTLSFHTHYIDN